MRAGRRHTGSGPPVTSIPYGSGAYRRDAGNFAELRLVNMFLEQAATSERQVALLSRKGLEQHSGPGNGPVTGIYSEPGVFGGDVFTLSGGVLYRGSDAIGEIAGDGPVSFAASDTELAVTAGTILYRYDGTTLDPAAFPDDRSVRAIRFHDGLFLAVADDSQRWYFSAVLDADTWGALDYASAERRPDPLLDILVLNDTAFLLGAATIEPWANTGDADLPYSRIEQRLFDKGIFGTGCAQELDNTLMWVGGDGIVYRLGEVPQRISDHGIEERIAASASVSTFSYLYQGHSFFCVRLGVGTFQFDLASAQWSELASYGRANFRGRCAVTVGTEALFGDDEEGKVWRFGGWSDDGEPIERLFTAGIPMGGGSGVVNNLSIEANVGWTSDLAGQGSDPVAELRASRDAVATWGPWSSAPLGQQGQFRTRTQWRRLGLFDPPGALFEIRCTDPVSFRVSAVRVNEAGGGRSRG
jgi:hypothetical protein